MYPSGTRVEKVNSKPDDAHPDGARATVVEGLFGSVHFTEAELEELRKQTGETHGYFVEWDDLPGLAVFVSGSRVREVGQ